MSYSPNRYRQDTLLERIELHNLVAAGLTERQALNIVYPTVDSSGRRINTNRIAKLNTWRRRGVYPLSDQDIRDALQMGLISDSPTSLAQPETTTDTDAIRAYMQSRLMRRSESIPGRWIDEQRVPTEHVGARIPLDLSIALKKLRGTATEHVIRALRLYTEALTQRRSRQEPETPAV